MRLTNQALAAVVTVGLGLLGTAWFLVPSGGSYDTTNEAMAFPLPRSERRIILGEYALDPVVPSAATVRQYNPFNLGVEKVWIEIDDLRPPPPPPLQTPMPAPLPLPRK
jgi:hypothetical protein